MMPEQQNAPAIDPVPQRQASRLRVPQWLMKLPDKFGLSSAALAFIALGLFAFSSWFATRQFNRPSVWHQPYARFSWQWFTHPVEWNINAGLPDVHGNVNSLALATDGKRLWMAGDAGLLAYSDTQGRSWTTFDYDPASGQFRAHTPSAVSSSHATQWLGTVYAAGPDEPAKKQSRPTSAPQSPTQNPRQLRPMQQTVQSTAKQSPVQQGPVRSIVPSTQTLDFGKVQFPWSGAQQIVFANQGSKEIKLSVVTPADKDWTSTKAEKNGSAPFEIAHNGCQGEELGAKGSCAVSVLFHPGYEGEFNAHLIAIGDPAGDVIVPVHGVALAKSPQTSAPTPKPTPTATPVTAPTPQTERWNPPANAPDLVAISMSPVPVIAAKNGLRYDTTDDGQTWKPRPLAQVVLPILLPSGATSPIIIGGKNFTEFKGRDGSDRLRLSKAAEYFDLPGLPRAELRAQGASRVAGRERRWAVIEDKAFPSRVWFHDESDKTYKPADANLFKGPLNALVFNAAGNDGWLAGADGVIFRTLDGGQHWLPASLSAAMGPGRTVNVLGPYTRTLPPWYWIALLLCALMMAPLVLGRMQTEKAAEQPSRVPPGKTGSRVPPSTPAPAFAIGNQAISDRPLEPGEPDALGLNAIASGLAFFLRHEKTRPPLALAIYGPWGSGKSSLMNLLKKNLEAYGSRPVWFNAWHHQKEEQLLAALLQAIKNEAVPPWSAWSGWTFRGRLGWLRLQRYWFRLALAGAAVFLIYMCEDFLRQKYGFSFGAIPHSFFITPPNTELHTLLDLFKKSNLVAVATGAVTVFKALSRGLTAFGVSPSSLLTTISGGAKIKDLEAQTSFRQRFAAEFTDVTRALGKRRRMLILVDDLDRCPPEKVREVLEAVNFLVSNGECFIVLGMARNIVEHCVGLSFSEVVDTLPWEDLGLSSDPTAPLDVAAKRRAFARLYLDKLVQIEVAVPEPSLLQKRLLFQSDEQNTNSARERRVSETLGFFKTMSTWLAPTVQALTVALVVAGSGMLAGRLVGPWAINYVKNIPEAADFPSQNDNSVKESLSRKEVPQPTNETANGKRSGQESTAGLASGSPSNSRPTGPTTSSFPAEKPHIDPGVAEATTHWFEFWPFYLALLGLTTAGSGVFNQLPQRQVRDTIGFSNALEIWHPLVLTTGARNTPRVARRFQNRVRYLAMRQRALKMGRPLPPGERWLRKVLRAPASTSAPPVVLPASAPIDPEIENEVMLLRSMLESGQEGESKYWKIKNGPSGPEFAPKGNPLMPIEDWIGLVEGHIEIPEPLLVALAAVDEYEPEWIAKEAEFLTHMGNNSPPLQGPDHTVFREAMTAHCRIWNDWYNLALYRRAYLRLGNEATSSGAGGKSFSAAASA